MTDYEFTIELTVSDNTAFTVLTALRGLGYAKLERVERGDVLRLRVRENAISMEECGKALQHAEVVFNPNKHRLTYATGVLTGEFEAVVADKDDDTAALRDLLSERFGVRGLESVDRATAWRLYDADGPAATERLEWACTALLANPFSQTHAVRPMPARAVVGAPAEK